MAPEPRVGTERPDLWGWLERYDLAIPTTVEYPVVTVSPGFAPGTLTIDGRDVPVDADTSYHDNCLIILGAVRTPPDRAGSLSRGCYLLVGLDDDGSAAWIVEFWSEGTWEPDASGLWAPTDPIDELILAGPLVDMRAGEYIVDIGPIRYGLSGVADPVVADECPPLEDPGFFADPVLSRWVMLDPASATVVGIDCEFQYSD